MPSRRFWTMDKQVVRIMAEQDFRRINVNRATLSEDSMREVVDGLTRDLGETLEVAREKIVKPQADFAARLSNLSSRK